MRRKTITRYYKNQKTGQYAKLIGSPIAIKRIENFEWPRQKVMAIRVSEREYRNRVKPIGETVQSIGWHYLYRPNAARESRRDGRKSIGHPLFFSYQ